MHIFFAYPFTQLCNDNLGEVDMPNRNFLEQIRNRYISLGHTFFLAHYREGWGKDLMGADICTPLDMIEMQKSDIVLAFPGSPISGGVHIELGWASALKKNICLFLDQNQRYSPLVLGLKEITNVSVNYYDDLKPNKIIQTIDTFIESLTV